MWPWAQSSSLCLSLLICEMVTCTHLARWLWSHWRWESPDAGLTWNSQLFTLDSGTSVSLAVAVLPPIPSIPFRPWGWSPRLAPQLCTLCWNSIFQENEEDDGFSAVSTVTLPSSPCKVHVHGSASSPLVPFSPSLWLHGWLLHLLQSGNLTDWGLEVLVRVSLLWG